jgi:hypothetical protein
MNHFLNSNQNRINGDHPMGIFIQCFHCGNRELEGGSVGRGKGGDRGMFLMEVSIEGFQIETSPILNLCVK